MPQPQPYTPVPQVTSQAPGAPPLHVDAPAGDFGGAAGQALQSAGQGLESDSNQIFQAGLRMRGMNNERDARNAQGVYMNQIGDAWAKYRQLEGQQAADAYPAFQKQVGDIRDNVAGTLGSPQAKNDFLNSAAFLAGRMTMGASSYAADQQKQSWIKSHVASIDNTTNFAVTMQNDPVAIEAGARSVADSAGQISTQTGEGPDAAQARATTEMGKYYSRIILARATDDAHGGVGPAQTLFDSVKGKMDAQSVVSVQQFLKNKAADAEGAQIGTDAASRALGYAPGGTPSPATDTIIQQSQAQNVPAVRALTWAKIESNLGAAPDQPGNTHTGVYQMGPGEFASAGGDPAMRSDVTEQVRAGVASIPKSMDIASTALGRPAADWEGYMVHQQGAAGGPALLKAPVTQNVVDALAPAYNGNVAEARAAVINNGGLTSMSVGGFLGMWRAKYSDAESTVAGTPSMGSAQPAAPPETEQSVMQHIISTVSDPVRQARALESAQRIFAIDRQGKQNASQQAFSGIVTQLLKDPTALSSDDIANNGALTAENKWQANQMRLSALEKSGHVDTAPYGSAYSQVYSGIFAPEGDPNRVGSAGDIFKRAGPGGDLTLQGADVLSKVLATSRKDPDQAALHSTAAGLMAYAKQHLSFQDLNSPFPVKDPNGEAIFNGTFVPKFEKGLAAWTAAGKDPWDYLTQENVDKIRAGMRSPAQMAKDRLAATGQTAPMDVEPPGTPIPSAPEGLNDDEWGKIMSAPPKAPNGQTYTHAGWAKALTLLAQSKDPKIVQQFDSVLGAQGFSGEDLLKRLRAPAMQLTPNPYPSSDVAP